MGELFGRLLLILGAVLLAYVLYVAGAWAALGEVLEAMFR